MAPRIADQSVQITNNINVNINAKKTIKGRRRVEIKKIEDNSKRHVTFSKRKGGLFNKAKELSVLTGAEIVGIVVSGKGKGFCKGFCNGHPIPDAVIIDRYLGHNASPLLPPGQPDHLYHQNYDVHHQLPNNYPSHVNTIPNSNKQIVEDYVEARRRMEAEKNLFKRRNNNYNDNINVDGERGGGCFGWWEKPIEMTTSLEELEEYMSALHKLKHNVDETMRNGGCNFSTLMTKDDSYSLNVNCITK